MRPAEEAGEGELEELPADAAADEQEYPERYKQSADDPNLITCREAPNLTVRMERGLSFSDSTARKAESGTIFLDGVAQSPPFLDSDQFVYNLDHHHGCVRSFTLSTCEQVYILIRKGLDLRQHEWTVYANEPDLDTVLAIWLLFNYSRVNAEASDVRDKILPLVRLEGVIDVHGFELTELTCFEKDTLEQTHAQMSELIDREIALKRDGRWSEADFAAYTVELLGRIDRMIYSPWDFEGFRIVDELVRERITDRQIVVICRSDSGIYEVEQQLRGVHGGRLGVIALEKGQNQYTLRQVNLFLPANLQRVYARLNSIDPAVRGSNCWGGSDLIGGAPRRTGTRLSAEQLAESIVKAYRKPSLKDATYALASGLLATIGTALAGWAAGYFWKPSLVAVTLGFLLPSLTFLAISATRYPRLFGLTLPHGLDWLFLSGGVLAGGLLGGSWLAPWSLSGQTDISPAVAAAALFGLPISAEILFRGVVHGFLAEEMWAQRSGGRWFLSWPVIISSSFFALLTISGLLPVAPPLPELLQGGGVLTLVSQALGALLIGVSCGMARERSESLLPPLLFHLAVALILSFWMI